MKYYLFLGYQLFERHNKAPTVRIYTDDTLVDEFICDNEKSIEMDNDYTEHQEWQEEFVKFKAVRKNKDTYHTPAKIKVYEVDSSDWNHASVIKIKVLNNASNNSNGFVSKRSMVLFNPVFLIPKKLYDNTDAMEKIFIKSCQNNGRVPGGKKYNRLNKRITWPGYSTYPDNLANVKNRSLLVSGGDFELLINIRKKHGIHFIKIDNDLPIGFFHIDEYTHAWYQHMKKYKFHVKTKSVLDKKDIMIATTELHKIDSINTNNED